MCWGIVSNSQVFDSLLVPKITSKQLIAPIVLLGSSLSISSNQKHSLVDWRNQHLPNFRTGIDDALSLSPVFFAYGFDAIGMQAKNDLYNRTAILCKAELLMLASVYPLKYLTAVQRPDGSDNHSFPSSHTAQAFLGATFLSVEYGKQYRWVPYAAYTMASSVALLRMANNKHFLPDVLAGAGMGILCQKVSYWTHQYKWRKKAKSIIVF